MQIQASVAKQRRSNALSDMSMLSDGKMSVHYRARQVALLLTPSCSPRSVMLDFLFAAGQFLCVLGLIYGLFLVLSHDDCVDSMRRHYDPITGHEMTRDELTSAAPASAERRARHERNPHAP